MKIIDIEDKELRELAMLTHKSLRGYDADNSVEVDEFLWIATQEGYGFWSDVNSGVRTKVNQIFESDVNRRVIPDVHQIFENKVESNPIFKKKTSLTVDEERKATPIFAGVLQYFPDAIKAVAQCSQAGNEQHHAGKPLHWDKTKSTDHAGSLTRHLMDVGTLDTDGVRHSAKVAWRALALLQIEIENDAKEA